MHIGTTNVGLNAWMMWVPDADIESGCPDAKAGHSWAGAPTQVSRPHQRMFLSFFLWAAANSGYRGASCSPGHFYDVNLTKNKLDWSFCDFE